MADPVYDRIDLITLTFAVVLAAAIVLLLSHLSDSRDGTTLVKEQSGLLFDIFRSYTSAKDTRGALKVRSAIKAGGLSVVNHNRGILTLA